jgi:hypothetical protein
MLYRCLLGTGAQSLDWIPSTIVAVYTNHSYAWSSAHEKGVMEEHQEKHNSNPKRNEGARGNKYSTELDRGWSMGEHLSFDPPFDRIDLDCDLLITSTSSVHTKQLPRTPGVQYHL